MLDLPEPDRLQRAVPAEPTAASSTCRRADTRDPRICDPDHIRAVAAVLRRPGVAIEIPRLRRRRLARRARATSCYCDPPYAPLSRTSSFANYTADGFAALDQQRLQQAVVRACRRGARVVMSNSSAPEIESAYQDAGRATGEDRRPPRAGAAGDQFARLVPRARSTS